MGQSTPIHRRRENHAGNQEAEEEDRQAGAEVRESQPDSEDASPPLLPRDGWLIFRIREKPDFMGTINVARVP